MDAFLEDDAPDAYEKWVDKLFGLSALWRTNGVYLAGCCTRYSDSHGYQDDRPRTMWPWRDWVVKAYNENLSYDRFITWQLAGDLLPEATYEQKLATGFNRNHAITQEGGVVNEEYVTEYVADRTQTAATAIMGITLECARCHDHKYDPISQKEYYQMFAFFNTQNERGQINYFDEAPVPKMKVEDPELEARISFLDSLVNIQAEKLDEMLTEPDEKAREWLATSKAKTSWSEHLGEGLISHTINWIV